MIRLRNMSTVEYQDLQDEYLQRLVEARAVEFDGCDVLNSGQNGNNKTRETYRALDECVCLTGLKNFLFQKPFVVNRENLRLLLVGPKELPRGRDGRLVYGSLRNEIERKIIGEIRQYSKSTFPTIFQRNSIPAQILNDIFNYDRLKNTVYGKKTAYWLHRRLDTRVCPFCNRMYTITTEEDDVRPAFDHYYPQSKYPYLAASLFNLIPICDVCNRLKGDKAELADAGDQDSHILYPYDESFDEDGMGRASLEFRIAADKPEAITAVLSGDSDAFTVEFHVETEDEPYKNRLASTRKLLKLDAIYEMYTPEVRDIVKRYYTYNDIAIKTIGQTLFQNGAGSESRQPERTTESVLIHWAKQILDLDFPPKSRWGDMPLNKLKADVFTQLNRLSNYKKKK